MVDRCGGRADRDRAVDGLRRRRAAGKGVTATTGTSGATDFGARRRYYRGGGGAAAAAAFAGIVGTGLAIAASQNRRDYYDDGYGYYGGPPAYYGGGPAYYGGSRLLWRRQHTGSYRTGAATAIR